MPAMGAFDWHTVCHCSAAFDDMQAHREQGRGEQEELLNRLHDDSHIHFRRQPCLQKHILNMFLFVSQSKPPKINTRGSTLALNMMPPSWWNVQHLSRMQSHLPMRLFQNIRISPWRVRIHLTGIIQWRLTRMKVTGTIWGEPNLQGVKYHIWIT